MNELLQTYWPLIVAALVVGVAIAWYVFHASRRTRITGTSRDVLDEGAAPAERNRALIDSAPAATPMEPAAGAAPAAPSAGTDDLTRIKGLGPKLAATLHGLGVSSFAQIAAWDDAEIDRIDAELGRFQGRIRRDDWVGQAKLLAQGDDAGFAERYGKLS
ncbi:hypothetical protein [Qipengyuania sp.]|uniref:hypothetical protein n=1 Tax=Qipengyuania sp. TaxID=2004515 RepID=UPI003AF8B1AC